MTVRMPANPAVPKTAAEIDDGCAAPSPPWFEAEKRISRTTSTETAEGFGLRKAGTTCANRRSEVPLGRKHGKECGGAVPAEPGMARRGRRRREAGQWPG